MSADSWPAFAGIVALIIGGWGTTILKQRATGKRINKVGKTADTINAQVTNKHTTNLRDDLTEALRLMGIVKAGVEKLQDNDIRLIRGDISRISGDIQVLRGELTDERDARTDLEQRFDDDRESRGGDH